VAKHKPIGSRNKIRQTFFSFLKAFIIASQLEKLKVVSGSERRRWYVHVALLTSLAGSLLSLIYLSHSITIHVIFGVAFMIMMLFHLFQRRRTI
jgi:hypothetical protein